MKRASSIAALLVALAICWATPAAGSTFPPRAPRAFVIIATGLRWSDIDATGTPTLFKLAGDGAVGNLNAKPRAVDAWLSPSALEGALEISAGNWVQPEFNAASAYNATETVGASSAAEAYRRVTGSSVGRAAVALVGLPPTSRTASVTADDVVLGTLGQAVEEAGGSTIAIGNSDAGDTTATLKPQRPAGVAAMDEIGLTRFGDVSRDLLAEDGAAPYGVRTDLSAFARQLAAAQASAAMRGGPQLVVLDPGDAYRAEAFAWQADPAVQASQHAQALRTLDAVMALALSSAQSGDVVIVAGEAPLVDATTGQQGFSPVLASGPGMSGYLTSASTHRAGMAANPDIAAAVLADLGIERPVQVIGNALTADSTTADASARIAHLDGINTTVTSIDSIRDPFTTALARFFALLLLLVAAFLAFGARLSPAVRRVAAIALKLAALAVFSLVAAGWVMFLFTPTLGSPAEAQLSLGASTLVLVAAGVAAWRWGPSRLAPALLALGTAALLCADQFVGAPLSVVNLLGYTPLQAARYYGIGNEAAALAFACVLTGTALLIDEWPQARFTPLLRRWGIPVLGALVIVAAAAPVFGANVGVAIWGTAGLLAAWAGFTSRRITWQVVLLGVAVILVLIAGFAAIDLFGGGAQTHLARSISTAEQGGISQLALIVQRKADTNGRVLESVSWWPVPLLAAVAFLGYVRLRRGAAASLNRNPSLAIAVRAGLIAGAVAFFTEDTGILLLTVILIPLGTAVAWLAISAAGHSGSPS